MFKQASDGMFEFEPEDVTGLKSALEKEREANKKFAPQIKAWEKLGKSPEEISALLEREKDLERKKEELELQDALKKGEYQKVLDGEAKKREEMVSKFGEKESMWAQREKKLLGQIERDRIETDAIKNFLEVGADPKRVHQLLKLTRENFRLEEGENGFDVQVIGQDGRTRIADSKGTAMGLKEFAAEVKSKVDEYGVFFTGVNASGGGAPNGKPTTPGTFTLTREQAKDPQAYQQARAAAEKAGTTVTITD